mmetsp:Transcript_15153/g.23978  ORF Transcript_15153/g.23978 Transcript_15153/m.23978 type:complete len:87 (+) Transcript_15153:263-523(+)
MGLFFDLRIVEVMTRRTVSQYSLTKFLNIAESLTIRKEPLFTRIGGMHEKVKDENVIKTNIVPYPSYFAFGRTNCRISEKAISRKL